MKWHFGHKLALIMTMLVLLASTILGYTLVYRQFSMMQTQFVDTGNSLSSQLAAASVELVFTEDELSLASLVFSLSDQPSVVAASVVNRDGEILAEAGVSLPTVNADQAFRSQGRIEASEETIWFYSPVVFRGVSGGAAWVGLDRSAMIAGQRSIIRSGIIVVSLLVLSITLIAIRLGQSLAKPVRDLIEGTRAIESGHYGFRIRGRHQGEFSDLTQSFNHMSAELEQKQRVEQLFSRFVSDPVAARYMAQDNVELAREGKRVDASILFVDLVGYTAFSEGRHPEETAEVLNLYFTEFANKCHEFHGNVDKYIGDCAMLVFGCPQSDPEHRYHAMECALQIRDRITAMNQERMQARQPCLDIRVGVSGGTVLAGLLGSHERMQYTVIGEPANLASRLCDLAESGQVVTDGNFYTMLNQRHELRTHANESHHIKGFQSTVEVLTVDAWASPGKASTDQNDSPEAASDYETRESQL
ncbi:adenylate/guanylate cyclase domain-containing protein [Saccharospirillum impatiens]|uniref:adenylate/guanylate cyclase domain-containing protein n=1 Tax=Saccharospirillum impatiens TaxID=169438 RepID=UPI00041768F9|nr:adenylate/guanylate cyclase domain-containing protein [Saccharospirillum impatiens]